MTTTGSVSIVRRFNSPKIQLKLKLALTLTDTGGGVLTLTDVVVVKFIYSLAQLRFWHIKLSFFLVSEWVGNQ